MTFVITNNSDKEIFIDFYQSDFIRNGFATGYGGGHFVLSGNETAKLNSTKRVNSEQIIGGTISALIELSIENRRQRKSPNQVFRPQI